MIDLRLLEAAKQQQEQQNIQQSPLAQKAAEDAMRMDQLQRPSTPEMQELLGTMRSQQEQEELRQKMNAYKQWEQDQIMMACGGRINRCANGGGIHIAPSKRGTFKAAASKHGMGVQEFASRVLAHKENYSPAMVKKANFARNASKWHSSGGPLNIYSKGDPIITDDQMAMRSWRWAPYSEISPDDRLVSRNEINSWVNSYDAQLPYQPQYGDSIEWAVENARRQRASDAKQKAVENFYTIAEQLAEYAHPFGRMFNSFTNPNGFGHKVVDRLVMTPIRRMIMRRSEPLEGQTTVEPSLQNDAVKSPQSQQVEPYISPEFGIPTHWSPDWEGHFGGGGAGNTWAKGGRMSPRRFNSPAEMIEHFEGFRASPYRDGRAYSVGYGQYMYGDGANLDWKNLLNGSKKLTREEGHQQVLRSINKLKSQLRNTLGDDLYSSLTPGQLMGYLDTGYQRPASMIAAAKVHRQKGAEAAARVLGVNGFAERNAARRAAFTGNYSGTADLSISPDMDSASVSQYFTDPRGFTPAVAGSEPSWTTIQAPQLQGPTPWWINAQQQSNVVAPQVQQSVDPVQALMPDLSIFNLGWSPATGRHSANTQKTQNGSFPRLFAPGGYLLDDAALEGTGWSWANAEDIDFKDDLYNSIVDKDGKFKDSKYLVDEQGKLVPSSVVRAYADNRSRLPVLNVIPNQELIGRYKKMIPNDEIRHGMYAYLDARANGSPASVYQRAADIFEAAGSPSIGFNVYGQSMTPYTITSFFGAPGTSVVPDILIDPNKRVSPFRVGEHIMEELPHVMQYNPEFNGGNRISSNVNTSYNNGYFSKYMDGENRYNIRGDVENDAHLIGRPAQEAFIFGTTPDYVINSLLSPDYAEGNNDVFYRNNRHLFQRPLRSVKDVADFYDMMSRRAAAYGRNNT